MTTNFTIHLLHGLEVAGRRHRRAELREPTGHDEAMLAELGADVMPAERVSALVAALTLRIGEIENPSPEQLLDLTVGDRERLILALCAKLIGPKCDVVAACPACGSLAEFSIDLEAVVSLDGSGPSQITLPNDDGSWTARIRPATGADLRGASQHGQHGPRVLILKCIEELANASGDRVSASELPSDCESVVAEALLALDPAAEIRFDATCPSCGGAISALLDGYALLQRKLGGARRVFEDVFRMARGYHWSEAEILALPLGRRRRYLDIADPETRP
jgi:hypothetical protein